MSDNIEQSMAAYGTGEHGAMTLDDLARFVQKAMKADIRGDACVHATVTIRGQWLKTINVTG